MRLRGSPTYAILDNARVRCYPGGGLESRYLRFLSPCALTRERSQTSRPAPLPVADATRRKIRIFAVFANSRVG
jgi:hypothetical protein